MSPSIETSTTAPLAGTETALRWAARALVAIVWISAGIFGAYILAFYGGSLVDGEPERWNGKLPGLYGAETLLATTGMALHFLGGGILLLLGPVQLLQSLRDRWRGLHRWMGRLFVTSSALAGLGGLGFIVLRGTLGGPIMDVGFGLYGALMVVAAMQTVRHARARRTDQHRAWGIRLFSLVIGSWLYRIEYGVWFMAFGGVGHTKSFDGPFDAFMAFAFFLPNLAVAELFIRARAERARRPALEVAAAIAMAGATLFLIVGTYYFTLKYWGPAIVARW